ncbi:DoxX protein [Nonlabens sp. Hel1_33_55]|uniref:BT_3928 family protein n=1 Tax=Nonlabens sp. Hel1_33_55 TaxID=1336802 RepID=UPI000875DB06|nr:BT_3928 family protein [Nonlabens sp. Hel1_33_55]SCX93365.1 DoxX protein [Nonlabens sp. Hel1_33_55]
MKLLVGICRVFVGVLFIFSGLVKLNDPVGFGFKLDEYFGAAVLGLEFLQPFALPLAIFLVILEVILGVMLLIAFQRKFTVWSLLLMIIFFTFLTFYSAYFNKVTDCGCFGDAIPLTPWESFTKDVILLFMIVILFMNVNLIQPIFKKFTGMVTTMLVTIGCFGIAYYVLMHLPIIDFRGYKIGTNINQAMQPDPERPDVYGYDWYYNENGNEEIITTKGTPPEGRPNYTKVETRLLEKGYEPPIHDFAINSETEGDITQEILNEPKVALLIMYNLNNTENRGMLKLPQIIKRAKASGYRVIALSSSAPKEADQAKSTYGLDVNFYTTDGTALKTVIRSNPGVVLLKNGVVTAKSHWNDFEEMDL